MSIKIDVKKKYKDFSLDVSLESNARHIGIMGRSGSGKSLLLKCISGIVKPDEGVISLDDRELFNSQRDIDIKTAKRKTGYLFQNYALFPAMSVKGNIMCVLSGSVEQKRAEAEMLIKKFGLKGLEKHLPSQLSGGEQQRCALARMMASKPDVILLDEPFSALDEDMRDDVMRELKAMLSDYKGVIITVSHRREEIYTMSDEVIMLEKGSVCERKNINDIERKNFF